MELWDLRRELARGKSLFDLPLRVTFYARVSTDKDEQLNSLENQVRYYTELIRSSSGWTYVPGYVDEGRSGLDAKKRDSFLRMIADARAGRFDFIITKEISRFSRSTLDSIQYTQALLDCGVGVLFQNDNINTLDGDSEFRLVVMAGVAQDEVRKLSERLRFGFRQAVKRGHVLGSDNLWGYDKKDCVLTVNEEEARVVRRIFDLYANHRLGIRRISRTLYDEGITSRQGGPFNVLTIRHILTNPKYKGWYCGGKTRTVDYRTARRVFLDESEWVLHPDPAVPAIVSEELWDRANELYRQRGAQAAAHRSGAEFHNRYPYSGKLFCEEHGTAFYRQMVKSAGVKREVWQCRRYRERGRAGCAAPQVASRELDQVLGALFDRVADRQTIADTVARLLRAVPEERGRDQALRREAAAIHAKKDRLLELSVAGAVTTEEFRRRNDVFNDQLQKLEERLREAQKRPAAWPDIRAALDEELMDPALTAAILDHVVVKKGSTREELRLDVYLKFGGPIGVVFDRQSGSFRFIRS